jgi:phosphoribosylformylglycinamidine synthase
MSRYRVEVRITPREGLLDPQGRAVLAALGNLGYEGVETVRVGRLIRLTVDAASEPEAADRVREMCERLIANPVTEDYHVDVLGAADGSGR